MDSCSFHPIVINLHHNAHHAYTGLAKEAAKYAMEGKVVSTSAEGHHLATFAGGCFWQVNTKGGYV